MAAKPTFVPGDEVSFLNEVGGGMVLSLVGKDHAKVRTFDGFEFVLPLKELVMRAPKFQLCRKRPPRPASRQRRPHDGAH
jgi:hypothetical protein